jgi:hypothetical protein
VRVQVNFLLEEVGFTLYGAIKQYLEGRLAESIRNQLRPHEGAHPEAVEAGLLTRLCLDYIDIKVGSKQGNLLAYLLLVAMSPVLHVEG